MPLTDAQFAEVFPRIEGRIFTHCVLGGLQDRLGLRARVRHNADFVYDWLETNQPPLATQADRDEAENAIKAAAFYYRSLDDEHARYGSVPMFIFAIFLKIIISVLIDWWLLSGRNTT